MIFRRNTVLGEVGINCVLCTCLGFFSGSYVFSFLSLPQVYLWNRALQRSRWAAGNPGKVSISVCWWCPKHHSRHGLALNVECVKKKQLHILVGLTFCLFVCLNKDGFCQKSVTALVSPDLSDDIEGPLGWLLLRHSEVELSLHSRAPALISYLSSFSVRTLNFVLFFTLQYHQWVCVASEGRAQAVPYEGAHPIAHS